MKKITTFLMAAAVVLAMSSCKDKAPKTETTAPATETAVDTAKTCAPDSAKGDAATAATAPTGKTAKVAGLSAEAQQVSDDLNTLVKMVKDAKDLDALADLDKTTKPIMDRVEAAVQAHPEIEAELEKAGFDEKILEKALEEKAKEFLKK